MNKEQFLQTLHIALDKKENKEFNDFVQSLFEKMLFYQDMYLRVTERNEKLKKEIEELKKIK